MSAYRIEKFTDKKGEHRVRIIAPNNKKTYSSQGYKNESDLEQTMYNNMVALVEYFKNKPK